MHQNYRKFQSQNVQIDWYVLHDTRGQNHSQTLKIQWFFFCEICTDTHLQASCGKDNLRTFCWDLLCIVSKVYSCQLTWMISKWLERSTISIPRWRNWWNTLIWENLHRFLIMCTWVALNVNANPRKYGWRNANPINVNVRVANLCWCNWKSYLNRKMVHMVIRGLTTWKDMRWNALNDIASWQTKQLGKCNKSLHHVLTTISSEKKN